MSDDDLFCKSCGAKQEKMQLTEDKTVITQPAAVEQIAPKTPMGETGVSSFSNGASVWSPAPQKKKTNMPVTLLSAFLALAIISTGFLGYKYIDDSNTIDTQQETISGLNADKTGLQSDLAAAQSTIQDVNNQLSLSEAQLATTEDELSAIQAKYPLRNFESLNKLQLWASSHKQTEYSYADDQYATALRVQKAAMEDGYLVSACISWGHADGYSYILCEAMVGTTVYYWFPETGIVQSYMTDIPVD
ncbi:hypothetical protein C1G87_0844 [Dehalococcoides mccartyi]|jgi:hypothetical protein|nr:hypothetical protein C1G87_0844 [Dehalococcoides mccartyi]